MPNNPSPHTNTTALSSSTSLYRVGYPEISLSEAIMRSRSISAMKAIVSASIIALSSSGRSAQSSGEMLSKGQGSMPTVYVSSYEVHCPSSGCLMKFCMDKSVSAISSKKKVHVRSIGIKTPYITRSQSTKHSEQRSSQKPEERGGCFTYLLTRTVCMSDC